MRTLECIRFRSGQPIGQKLAKRLLDTFQENALSQGILMTVWLDRDLLGDLCVHLENKPKHGANQQESSLGLSIEQALETYGIVSRQRLVLAGTN